MSFAVLSWNVKGFRGGTDNQVQPVADLILNCDPAPDVIAIYEVLSSHGAFQFARHFFPEYTCFITEGQNSQEIVILVKRQAFDFVTITQKYRFKIGNPNLRPGVLATLTRDGIHTNILFLHVASNTLADGFGDRFEILSHALNLNEKVQELGKLNEEPARLIVTGDLNTMGLQFPRKTKGYIVLTGQDEKKGLEDLAARACIDGLQGMSFAAKDHDLTYRNKSGRLKGDLDHVLVSDQLQLEQLGGPNEAPFQVSVIGWSQFDEHTQKNEIDDFIDKVSDHCALYFRVT
jgi:exonuclease III